MNVTATLAMTIAWASYDANYRRTNRHARTATKRACFNACLKVAYELIRGYRADAPTWAKVPVENAVALVQRKHGRA